MLESDHARRNEHPGAAIRAETEKALQQALGETFLKKYRQQLNLHWLDALHPAPPAPP